ncbi:MAG: class I SAM-dependent methyltransferase [Moraxellaceae bacterium]|nr:class I SAM-dependent methyltransferase [Moraxellaceae bacterium]MDP1776037.1 class I SAM-dependent methyltransferase [Moraxellaceae bacterium]MDZ4299131.1 class I SAM-dependent methyltransferase [Moraxellaceae bacterium]MDZ4386253.1 class I SAM-dependent methyltransferase [Moraxellaceae bacterium]
MNCPLCGADQSFKPVTGADKRRFWLCLSCDLIFADPSEHLSPTAEKAFYGTHHNTIESAGYVAFLQRLLTPALAFMRPGMRALDYGCGPGPVMSELVHREGLSCDNYDPFFAPELPSPPYDIIFASECFEHFHRPQQELQRILSLLAPSGYLAIMTEHWQTKAAFASWYYSKDPTHVVFFNARSIDFICRQFGFRLCWQDGRRVVILQRINSGSAEF